MSVKKQIISIVVVLVILGGIIAGYVVMRNSDNGEKKDKKEQIRTYDSKAVNKLKYTTYGKTYSLEKKNDKWTDTNNKKSKLDSKSVQTAIDSLSLATVKNKFDDYKSLEDYGFETKNDKLKTGKQVITVTTKDGKEYTYYVGLPNPNDQSKTYVMLKGDKSVYLSETEVFNAFLSDPETIGQQTQEQGQGMNMVQ